MKPNEELSIHEDISDADNFVADRDTSNKDPFTVQVSV